METTILGANDRPRVALWLLAALIWWHQPPPIARAVELPVVGTHEGEMYPDFYLPKVDGGFGRLSDYRGKKVLLIHFASW